MRIAVDLDNTLNNFPEVFLKFVESMGMGSYSLSDITSYGFAESFGWSREKAIEVVYSFYTGFCKR